jgi:hypothetical protein
MRLLSPEAAACCRGNANAYRSELHVVQNTVTGTPEADEVVAGYPSGAVKR